MPEQSNVVKTVLSNGLTIQLKEIHTAPIISSWMWYRVGSRNEIAWYHRGVALGGAYAIQGHSQISTGHFGQDDLA